MVDFDSLHELAIKFKEMHTYENFDEPIPVRDFNRAISDMSDLYRALLDAIETELS